jgi:hypothetical protein
MRADLVLVKGVLRPIGRVWSNVSAACNQVSDEPLSVAAPRLAPPQTPTTHVGASLALHKPQFTNSTAPLPLHRPAEDDDDDDDDSEALCARPRHQ